MAGWQCQDRDKISWDGTIQANSFIGDGQQITGLTDKFIKDYVYNNHQEVTSEGVLIEDFETIGDWTVAGTGATQEAATECKQGTYALKLNALNGNYASSTKTINKDFSAVTNFILWEYVDTANLNNIEIYISSVEDWSKYFKFQIDVTRYNDGWNRLVIDKNKFSSSGGESWANTMIRLRVRVNPQTGEDCSVIFDDFKSDYAAKPKVIITFDDGFQNVYDKAYPIMYENGQKGVLFIVKNLIDTTNYMTLSMLKELYNINWDISNHTETHQNLTLLSSEQMHSEIDNCDAYLKTNGFQSLKFFAYPYGFNNSTIIEYLKSKNFLLGRIVGAGEYQPHLNMKDEVQYQIKAVNIINTTTPATVQGVIDQLINQKGLLVLLFHQIVDADADIGTKYLTASFAVISNYLAAWEASGSLTTTTFSEYYQGYSRM